MTQPFPTLKDASSQTSLHQKAMQAGAQAAGACRQGSGRGQAMPANSSGVEERNRPASQGAQKGSHRLQLAKEQWQDPALNRVGRELCPWAAQAGTPGCFTPSQHPHRCPARGRGVGVSRGWSSRGMQVGRGLAGPGGGAGG